MPWQQLTVQIDSSGAEPLEQFIFDHGALSVTYQDAEDQPVFQQELGSTPLWDLAILSCLFDHEANLDSLLIALKQHPAVIPQSQIKMEVVEDKDWERCWMDDFKAMQYADNLWICPSWLTPPDPSAVNIILDPGLAFGSGSHETTSLCLQWLAQANLTDLHIIDYGCGSGVLAIAAALLGAGQVTAVDNDPQAILATGDNRLRNNISSAKLKAYLPPQTPSLQGDILVANILAAPLISLAPELAKLVKPQGTVVLSGILENQADEVIASYQEWFEMEAVVTNGDWIRLVGKKLNMENP
ncbi:MAG: 50S ribosomal protein L11 methyltransferase [SAR86 cluster bacterium]|uniref:Ribosomal protein L11 methyltransferase n=1 Tax=SAR86 cluster bacterium TaxID=2030880 RepID=A0A2A4MJA3_9GAMM|nr:MAG: 50S ribosomal protein L11 methyltransferase [SAR86 cluster bacterium]